PLVTGVQTCALPISATDACCRFHCNIGVVLGNQDRVRLRSGPGASGDESTGLHNAVEPASVDHEIFDDRESTDAERLDCDRFAVVKFSHVKLAHSARM